MKKRLLSILLASVFAISMIGCGSKKEDHDDGLFEMVGFGDDSHGTSSSPIGGGTGSGSGGVGFTQDPMHDGDFKYTPTAAASVKFVNYTDPEGLFTMQIPEGWQVETYGPYLGHLIIAYDPTDNTRQILYCDSLQGYATQSQADTVYMSTGQQFAAFTTVEELVNEAGKYSFGYENFTVLENLGNNGYGDILLGTLNWSGVELETMATAYIVRTGGVNLYGFECELVYGDGYQMIMAKPEEFVDWEPVLTQTIGSIQFTDKFWQGRQEDWNQIQQQSMAISQMSNNIASMQMSAWEQRQTTYDIMRAEQSDANLGYDRYYDTQTGQVYLVEYGVMDGYSGNRYELVESGSSYYNLPVTGYVYK